MVKSPFGGAGHAESRRRFLRQTIFTAAGAPLALSLGGRALGQDVGEKARETGTVTLDALLVTYLSAPIGSDGTATWELTRHYETALTLGGVDGIDLVARVPDGAERIFVGEPYAQSASHDALLLRRRDPRTRIEITTAAPGTPDHTIFFGLRRPRLRLRETRAGGSERRLSYRLEGAESTFLFNREDLLGDPEVASRFGPGTAESYLAAYRFEPEALVEPRYEEMQRPPGGGDTIELARLGRDTGQEVAVATSAAIVAQEGFTSGDLAEAFAVGGTISVAHRSRQSPTAKPIVRVEARLDGAATAIYWDRAFKTFVFAAA